MKTRMIVCAVLAAIVAFASPGCSKQRALNNVDTAIELLEDTTWIDAAAWTIEKVRLGVIPWEMAWEQLRPAMPAEFAERVQTALDAGETLADAMDAVLASAREDQATMLARLREARKRIEESPDPLTTFLEATEASALLVAAIAGGGTLVSVLAGVRAVVAVFNRGKKAGAHEVSSNIAVARKVDPEFDAKFSGDTPASRAMKAGLADMSSEIVDEIHRANLRIKNKS